MSKDVTKKPPPRKRWGQNFLTDQRAIRRIVEAIGPPGDPPLIEIGPGRGALTRELLEAGFALTAWEIDPMLVPLLEEEFAYKPLKVVETDALEGELPGSQFRAIGNLPYNVANPIIRKLLWSGRCERAVFMVQKEVADRYLAEPGDPDWGYLGASTRLVADSTRLLRLGPGAFHPKPKVDSTVVVFEPATRGFENDALILDQLLSAAFRQRRKTLANNLSGYRDLGKAAVIEILEELGIDPAIRAEALDLAAFDQIASRLHAR